MLRKPLIRIIPQSTSQNSIMQGKSFVYLCASIACLSGILLGYDIGVISGALVYMEKDLLLSHWDEEVIVAALPLFSIAGCLLSGQLAASYGRKKTIAVAAVLFFTGSVVMASTKVFAIIVFGRILLGMGTGLALVIGPLYTAELSPSYMRGKLVSLNEISINSGILFGYFIAWIFYFIHDNEAWRIMLLIGCIPALVLFCGMLIMPESPRWLVEHGQIEKARTVLQKISVHDDSHHTRDVDTKIQDIQKTIALERRQGEASWLDLLLPCVYKPAPMIRKALIIASGVACFQQATGVDAVTYYTPFVFRELGLTDEKVLLATTIMGVTKLLFIFIAMALLDRVGRRPLLLVSSVGMIVALCGMVMSFLIGRPAGFTIVLQCSYVAVFSLGWGPICWVMISEIFPLQIRSKGMAVATCANRLTAGLVSLFFLSMEDVLTPIGTWILFLIVSVFALVFVYRLVPETKNKTLEQITNDLMFGTKHQVVPDSDNISDHLHINQQMDAASNGSNDGLEMADVQT
eukprot:100105_1